MQALFEVVGISRQAFHQRRKALATAKKQAQILIKAVKLERIDHPSMGARSLYRMWQLDPQKQHLVQDIGRDRFEAILLDNGLRVRHVIAYHKTTHPGTYRFENRIAGQTYTDINQVWASDITYLRVQDQFAYLTIILDLYSRRCLAAVASQKMTAEATVIPAIKQAIKERKGQDLTGCIFHSDAGGQYIDKNFLKLTQKSKMINSMADSCFENPHVEKFHDIIKNDYLYQWKPTQFIQLPNMIQRFIFLYNHKRPHSSIGNIPPVLSEQQNHKIQEERRSKLTIKPIV
ncbi:MAG: IS3 family transposase [Bacteroidota bacterium]